MGFPGKSRRQLTGRAAGSGLDCAHSSWQPLPGPSCSLLKVCALGGVLWGHHFAQSCVWGSRMRLLSAWDVEGEADVSWGLCRTVSMAVRSCRVPWRLTAHPLSPARHFLGCGGAASREKVHILRHVRLWSLNSWEIPLPLRASVSPLMKRGHHPTCSMRPSVHLPAPFELFSLCAS